MAGRKHDEIPARGDRRAQVSCIPDREVVRTEVRRHEGGLTLSFKAGEIPLTGNQSAGACRQRREITHAILRMGGR